MNDRLQTVPGTLVWIAPFYNRSGYGVGARATVFAMHRAGVRIRVVPVNEIEPGIDDCDMALIQSLESTPVVPPITAIVSHVPGKAWLGIKLPEPNLRIMATTFDSSAQGCRPPAEWIEVCREMDQVWLVTPQERQAFLEAGLAPEKIQIMHWPHPWVENPLLPPIMPPTTGSNKPFRFLSIAMFQPRRRWDTLIEAFLEEFRNQENVELYLKVNYPPWHPIAGKPRQDLHDLIDSLRRKTGSKAPVTIDEALGTRTGIVRLMDSANVYVSTDTAATAPIGEAFARQRLVVMPAGLGLITDNFYVPIAADPDAKRPFTREMLLYQPHHAGSLMPQLHLKDVRSALRLAYAMPPDEREARIAGAARSVTPPSVSVPMAIKAIEAGWANKRSLSGDAAKNAEIPKIVWEGSQLVSHSLALINRELCLRLMDSGYEVSIVCGREKDDIRQDSDPRFAKIVQRTFSTISGKADVHVRHHWPPNFNPPAEGHWVMIQPWEYGRLPEDWIAPMASLVDEMWVPTRHVQKTYISSGVPADRVQVVPNGVNPDQFHPDAAKRELDSSKQFRFLFIGGGLWRKGVDVLLDAYRAAFTIRDDVVLVIKDLPQQQIYIDQGLAKIIADMRKDRNSPEILHLATALQPFELPGLYTACDCLVHPYRAEGFALPVLEAMACGVPVITSAGGSTDDFCPPDQVFLIPCGRREFYPKDVRLAGGGGWVLEPDCTALQKQMREAFENRYSARERALKFSERVRLQYDWKNVAEKVMSRIDALVRKPIKRRTGE